MNEKILKNLWQAQLTGSIIIQPHQEDHETDKLF